MISWNSRSSVVTSRKDSAPVVSPRGSFPNDRGPPSTPVPPASPRPVPGRDAAHTSSSKSRGESAFTQARPVGVNSTKPLALEQHERLPHRHPAHPETLRHRGLGETGAGGQLARDDLRSQPRGGGFGKGGKTGKDDGFIWYTVLVYRSPQGGNHEDARDHVRKLVSGGVGTSGLDGALAKKLVGRSNTLQPHVFGGKGAEGMKRDVRRKQKAPRET
jgi:hypothetical protein